MFEVEKNIDLIDEILSDWKQVIGKDFLGYRNHVHRMIHFCFYLHPSCSNDEREKIIIAGVFHDIGIWTENTLDYIAPSAIEAEKYLKSVRKQAWSEEIGLMITEHHKLSKDANPRFPLIEIFRKGDLVDFSLGNVKCGVERSIIRDVKSAFPNAGFHWMLTKRAIKWTLLHPLNPAPMMKR